MNIFNSIGSWFKRDRKDALEIPMYGGFFGGSILSCKPFAKLIFANICDILADLGNDVELTNNGSDTMRFVYFKLFYERNFHKVFHLLWEQGYAVIGTDGERFSLLRSNEYTTTTAEDGSIVFLPNDKAVQVYIMESDTYSVFGMSDKQLCKPALDYLDSVLNASHTIANRLGAFIVATPKSPQGASVGAMMSRKEKEDLEKEVREKYGAKSEQSQILILPNEMDFKTMSLASIDVKTTEKVTAAVCMICDRIGVPANQVALIDTHSNKALANGSELREGDYNKYQSFERMLEFTFIQMANAYGLKIDYTIYNKPERIAQTKVENAVQTETTKPQITDLGADLLGVLSTNEKREALGYAARIAEDGTILAQTLGVGGTQSLVEIAQSDTISDEEKRGYMQVLFGLNNEQIDKIIPKNNI